MNLMLHELKERLASNYDECSLIDLLGINSYQIVEAFSDLIEDRMDELVSLFDEEEDEEDS